MTVELSVARSLFNLVNEKKSTVPAVVGLGLLAALLEGFGLTLFAPLLTLLSRTDGGTQSLPGSLWRYVEALPENSRMAVLVLVVLAAIAFKNIISYFNLAHFARIDGEIDHRIRTDLVDSILASNMTFIQQQPAGVLANAVLSETSKVSQSVNALFLAAVSLCAATVFSIVLFLVSWQATLLAIPILGAALYISSALTRSSHRTGKESFRANMVYTRLALESLAGLQTIQTSGQSTQTARRLRKASAEVRLLYESFQRVSGLHAPLSETIIAITIGILLVLLQVMDVSLPTTAAFLIILYRLQPHFRNLATARSVLHQVGHAVVEIERIRAACVAAQRVEGIFSFSAMPQEIRFDSVRAGYGRGEALKPSQGRILVDGVDLFEIASADWYRSTALVPQNVFLFDGSIAENIAYGSIRSDRDEIIRAAHLAGAYDFISDMPDGFDTITGERGVLLSGGQCQRIALARALLRRPQLLLLDEATNALDSHSEETVLRALEMLRRDTTIVYVAHRLSTVRTADEILVVDAGRIVERGDYETLLLKGGLFAAMVGLQEVAIQTTEEMLG